MTAYGVKPTVVFVLEDHIVPGPTPRDRVGQNCYLVWFLYDFFRLRNRTWNPMVCDL